MPLTSQEQAAIDKLVADLRSRAPHSSGALQNSIRSKLIQADTSTTIEISMLPYGIFQDKGVNGTKRKWGSPFSFKDKRPPTSAFKGVSTLASRFAIASSIYYNGFKGKPWIDAPIDKNIDQLTNIIITDQITSLLD